MSLGASSSAYDFDSVGHQLRGGGGGGGGAGSGRHTTAPSITKESSVDTFFSSLHMTNPPPPPPPPPPSQTRGALNATPLRSSFDDKLVMMAFNNPQRDVGAGERDNRSEDDFSIPAVAAVREGRGGNSNNYFDAFIAHSGYGRSRTPNSNFNSNPAPSSSSSRLSAANLVALQRSPAGAAAATRIGGTTTTHRQQLQQASPSPRKLGSGDEAMDANPQRDNNLFKPPITSNNVSASTAMINLSRATAASDDGGQRSGDDGSLSAARGEGGRRSSSRRDGGGLMAPFKSPDKHELNTAGGAGVAIDDGKREEDGDERGGGWSRMFGDDGHKRTLQPSFRQYLVHDHDDETRRRGDYGAAGPSPPLPPSIAQSSYLAAPSSPMASRREEVSGGGRYFSHADNHNNNHQRRGDTFDHDRQPQRRTAPPYLHQYDEREEQDVVNTPHVFDFGNDRDVFDNENKKYFVEPTDNHQDLEWSTRQGGWDEKKGQSQTPANSSMTTATTTTACSTYDVGYSVGDRRWRRRSHSRPTAATGQRDGGNNENNFSDSALPPHTNGGGAAGNAGAHASAKAKDRHQHSHRQYERHRGQMPPLAPNRIIMKNNTHLNTDTTDDKREPRLSATSTPSYNHLHTHNLLNASIASASSSSCCVPPNVDKEPKPVTIAQMCAVQNAAVERNAETLRQLLSTRRQLGGGAGGNDSNANTNNANKADHYDHRGEEIGAANRKAKPIDDAEGLVRELSIPRQQQSQQQHSDGLAAVKSQPATVGGSGGYGYGEEDDDDASLFNDYRPAAAFEAMGPFVNRPTQLNTAASSASPFSHLPYRFVPCAAATATKEANGDGLAVPPTAVGRRGGGAAAYFTPQRRNDTRDDDHDNGRGIVMSGDDDDGIAMARDKGENGREGAGPQPHRRQRDFTHMAEKVGSGGAASPSRLFLPFSSPSSRGGGYSPVVASADRITAAMAMYEALRNCREEAGDDDDSNDDFYNSDWDGGVLKPLVTVDGKRVPIGHVDATDPNFTVKGGDGNGDTLANGGRAEQLLANRRRIAASQKREEGRGKREGGEAKKDVLLLLEHHRRHRHGAEMNVDERREENVNAVGNIDRLNRSINNSNALTTQTSPSAALLTSRPTPTTTTTAPITIIANNEALSAMNELLLLTERSIDRHYGCPSKWKALAMEGRKARGEGEGAGSGSLLSSLLLLSNNQLNAATPKTQHAHALTSPSLDTRWAEALRQHQEGRGGGGAIVNSDKKTKAHTHQTRGANREEKCDRVGGVRGRVEAPADFVASSPSPPREGLATARYRCDTTPANHVASAPLSSSEGRKGARSPSATATSPITSHRRLYPHSTPQEREKGDGNGADEDRDRKEAQYRALILNNGLLPSSGQQQADEAQRTAHAGPHCQTIAYVPPPYKPSNVNQKDYTANMSSHAVGDDDDDDSLTGPRLTRYGNDVSNGSQQQQLRRRRQHRSSSEQQRHLIEAGSSNTAHPSLSAVEARRRSVGGDGAVVLGGGGGPGGGSRLDAVVGFHANVAENKAAARNNNGGFPLHRSGPGGPAYSIPLAVLGSDSAVIVDASARTPPPLVSESCCWGAPVVGDRVVVPIPRRRAGRGDATNEVTKPPPQLASPSLPKPPTPSSQVGQGSAAVNGAPEGRESTPARCDKRDDDDGETRKASALLGANSESRCDGKSGEGAAVGDKASALPPPRRQQQQQSNTHDEGHTVNSPPICTPADVRGGNEEKEENVAKSDISRQRPNAEEDVNTVAKPTTIQTTEEKGREVTPRQLSPEVAPFPDDEEKKATSEKRSPIAAEGNVTNITEPLGGAHDKRSSIVFSDAVEKPSAKNSLPSENATTIVTPQSTTQQHHGQEGEQRQREALEDDNDADEVRSNSRQRQHDPAQQEHHHKQHDQHSAVALRPQPEAHEVATIKLSPSAANAMASAPFSNHHQPHHPPITVIINNMMPSGNNNGGDGGGLLASATSLQNTNNATERGLNNSPPENRRYFDLHSPPAPPPLLSSTLRSPPPPPAIPPAIEASLSSLVDSRHPSPHEGRRCADEQEELFRHDRDDARSGGGGHPATGNSAGHSGGRDGGAEASRTVIEHHYHHHTHPPPATAAAFPSVLPQQQQQQNALLDLASLALDGSPEDSELLVELMGMLRAQREQHDRELAELAEAVKVLRERRAAFDDAADGGDALSSLTPDRLAKEREEATEKAMAIIHDQQTLIQSLEQQLREKGASTSDVPSQ